MPQVHGGIQMYVFGSCLPSGCCRAVQQRIITRALEFYRLLLWGSTQLSLLWMQEVDTFPSSKHGGSLSQTAVVATAHICGVVEPSSIL